MSIVEKYMKYAARLKIGLDCHGILDKFPSDFELLTKFWSQSGHEIHILTGKEADFVRVELDNLKIHYDHIFSIVDHNLAIGTKMWKDDAKGKGWWMGQDDWDKSKGEYARKVGLDLHIDNELRYAPWFPKSCTFMFVQDGPLFLPYYW